MSSDAVWFQTVSNALGWGYFFAWSLSFYGPLALNIRNKSAEGIKMEFLGLNIQGYTFYLAYTIKGYFFPNEHLGQGEVDIQDFAFAAHAFVLSAITLSQAFIYPRGNNKLSLLGWFLVIGYASTAIVFVIIFQCTKWIPSTKEFNMWLFLGDLKVSITILKYIPQMCWNYKRKSTYGWSIFGILLDFIGGILSVAQNMLTIIQNGWVEFNPIKFLLGNITIVFDIVFIVQHYILYRSPKEVKEGKKITFVELPEATA